MDDILGGRALIYRSASIYERRRRVLAVARKMIAEHGFSGFNVRELCARAGIAQKTLYNAFGSKENVVAMAIRQYQADFNERVAYQHDPVSVIGRLERAIKVHSRNLEIRPYTTAIMAVYNSPTADRAIRTAIRELAYTGITPWAMALRRRRQFSEGVTMEAYIQLSVTAQYAVLTDWCVGEIEDMDLVDRVCGAALIILLGTTRGQTLRDARTWLHHLHTNAPAWLDLRQAANFHESNLAPRPPRAETRGA